jgi:hypothetical protein
MDWEEFIFNCGDCIAKDVCDRSKKDREIYYCQIKDEEIQKGK